MKLHERHRRRLEATTELMDNALVRVERLLVEGGRSGIVRAEEDTLRAQVRADLLEKVRRLRSDLQIFAERFGLERHSRDARQVLNAEFSSLWVMLENCRPKRMKGYGVEFDEQAKKALEESVEQLLAQVNALRELL